MKTLCTILHYYNKIVVLVFHPNWGPYTWNFHWIENVIHHLTSQSLVWRSVRTVRTISWFSAGSIHIKSHDIFSMFYFIKNKHRFYNPCKFFLTERKRLCLSSLLKYTCSIFFFNEFRKYTSCWHCNNYRACCI